MRRREFLGAVAGAVTRPEAAHAQQPATTPVIGFLHSGSAGPNARRVAGFRQGLADAGFIDGQNVSIEFRWAEGQDARLPELAQGLIRQGVAVIATLSSTVAAVAAKAATTTTPIYFLVADPPVELGLVSSLNRPGGNATGITTLAAEVAGKRLSVLRELMPQAAGIAALLKPTHPSTKAVTASLQATATSLGVPLQLLAASTEREIDEAYAAIQPNYASIVATDPFFFAHRTQLVGLAARHAVASIYDSREFAEAGGLASYGPNHVRLWQQAAGYVARILRGEKPEGLPVVQASIFELVFNFRTARALGVSVPLTLQASADEVIE
jgi:putative ABC transport system substrate-binding protein